ncbi:MAG: lytic murein transglycosylase [Patescibacteria group bacterium]
MKKLNLWLFLFCFLPFLVLNTNTVFADARSDKIQQLEASIDQYAQQIQKKESEARSLANQISIFELQIKQAQAEIDATNLTINGLSAAIKEKERSITLEEKEITKQNGILSQYLREAARNDSGSFLEFLLKNNKFSDFFSDLNYSSNIQSSIQETLGTIKKLKGKLILEKTDLELDKAEQEQLKRIQNKQKTTLESSKKQKQTLLDQTKGQEKTYQQLLTKAREDLDKIRNQPYELAMGFKMTFEEALSHALPASQLTGVRAAFLLAIVKIESDWGGNVGKGNWRTDMPLRDHEAFLAITSSLGLNPDSTPVSKKPSYGWGGAMGPAQFIPSTWILYTDAVSNLTGRRPASPWNIEDAFIASGLMLAESGANKQTYASEVKAAKMYIAGGRWNTSLTARIYSNNVMAEATKIQRDIDTLNQAR